MPTSSGRMIIGNDWQWQLWGGAGDDYIKAGNGGVSVDAGAGNDTIIGGRGDDVLLGGDGNDKIYLSDPAFATQAIATGSDEVSAGAGDDTLYGGKGTYDSDARAHGGSGNDVFLFSTTREGDYTLYGESGNDVFNTGTKGGHASFFLYAGDGNDSVTAAGGYQEIHGDCGHDVINASEGEFLVYGGDGNDVVHLNTHASGVVYGDGGDDTLSGDVSAEYFELNGGCGNDVLFGTGSVCGYVDGGVYHGDEGNDTITGANTGELLFGDAGCDVLKGNGGNDCLWGGTGSDVFVFGRTAAGGTHYSATIKDFQDGVDIVALQGLGLCFRDLHISAYHEGSVSGTSVHYVDNLGIQQEINFEHVAPCALSAADFHFVA